MIKKIQKIGNSQGIILEKALLKLLKIDTDMRVEVIPKDDGILLRKVSTETAYEKISKKHRSSLDKLGK
jgi:antitoxin component of MazEF toxin-antitoxin module